MILKNVWLQVQKIKRFKKKKIRGIESWNIRKGNYFSNYSYFIMLQQYLFLFLIYGIEQQFIYFIATRMLGIHFRHIFSVDEYFQDQKSIIL